MAQRQQQRQQQMQQAQLQPLPAEVHILAATHKLGTLQAQYRARLARMSTRAVVVLTLLSLLTAAGLGAYVYFLHGNLQWLIPAVILACVGIGLAYNALRYYGLSVYVFTEGFIRVRGEKTDVFRWEQIKTIWQKASKRYIGTFNIRTSYAYTVQGDDGKKFTFNNGLNNVERLGGTLIQEAVNRLLPDAIARYDAGEHVNFGKLSVSIHGISNGEEIILWNQINSVQVVKDMLTINKNGEWVKWQNINVPKTPNFPVFMALINYVKSNR